jgi:hypothetical protein
LFLCCSKATGGQRIKYKKGPIAEHWKQQIVQESITRKHEKVHEQDLDQTEIDDGVDLIIDRIENFLVFDSEEETDDDMIE